MGVELKKNVKELWWKAMVYEREDIEGLDASILMHPRVWEASGHVEGFTDPMVDCKKCKARFRADQLDQVQCPQKPSKHPGECDGELTEPRLFNLMFKTFMGPVEDDANTVFIRPETAQGIYVNFHNVREASRRKLPFGIAQVGKAFRNEITPGNYIFRTREFEQMEMQYFVKPGTDEDWFEYWKEARLQWYRRLGIRKENLHFHQHGEKELAHYAKAAFDIEFKFPFGWSEIEGIHNRTDFDLGRHQDYSKKNMQYFDQEAGERYVPYVVETSTGVDRLMLTALADAYYEEEVQEEKRVVMRLSPVIAPMKAAVFPLVKKDGMPEIARNIVDSLRQRFRVFYDESGAVGRRYRRQDEIGTPYCFTVDSQTLEDDTVTVRDRDTMVQERISRDRVMDYLLERVMV
jgi:glycyl-tRNA synthetase